MKEGKISRVWLPILPLAPRIKRFFFKLLVETDNLNILNKLNNKGIYNLEVALVFIEQLPETLKEQKKYLLIIKEEMIEILSQFENNTMAYIRRKEFIDKIESVIRFMGISS